MNCYGLGWHRIESELPLHGLAPCADSSPPIAQIRRAELQSDAGWMPLSDDADSNAATRIRCWRRDAQLRLRFEYLAHFADFILSDAGTRIAVATSGDVPESTLSTLIEGPVLGRALRLQGRGCLHATILVLGDRGVGLAGPSRAGKSTLAAALVRAGCTLLTDDLAFIEPAGDGLRALPGKAQVKLWPDAAEQSGGVGAPVLPGIPAVDKVVVPMGESLTSPVQLHTIYQLAPRDADLATARIEDLPPPSALAVLAANLYGTIPADRALRQAELTQVASLAGRVRVRRLTLPNRLGYLDEQGAELRARIFA